MGVVVTVGIDGQLAQELSGDGIDDAHFEVLNQQDDVGSGVGSSDPDVMQPAVDAERHGAGFVDAVVTDPVVGVGVPAVARQCFGHRVIERRRGRTMWQRSVGSAVVVVVDELIEQRLELVDGGGLDRLSAEPLLERLLERSTLP